MRETLHRIDEALQSAIHRMRRHEEACAELDEPYMRGTASGLRMARRELVRVSELLVYALEDARSIDAIAAREELAMAAERGDVAYYGPEALQAFAAELAETDHD